MSRRRDRVVRAWVAAGVLAWSTPAGAHSGPPFPIISNEVVGAYKVSLWTDPDVTDDGDRQGQFWVMVDPASGAGAPPADLRAHVTIRPTDRPGPEQAGWAEPIEGDTARQFVALLMDHEGLFSVRLELDGAGGPATLDSTVEATYDLRPARWLLGVYLVPFLLVGLLWGKLLLRRRRAHVQAAG